MQALIVAALPLLGVLIGAALQYGFGQRLEGRKLLVAQKALAYSDFIRATAASGRSRDADKLALIADAKTRICIYGSFEVVQNLSDFDKSGAIARQREGQDALAALFSAMRKDVTGRGFSGREDVFVPLLFGRYNANTTAQKS